MKTILLAAAALSLGIGSAYADAPSGAPNTLFTGIPGVFAKASPQTAPSTTAQNGPAMQAYVTNSNRGTWLFPPNANQGGNN